MKKAEIQREAFIRAIQNIEYGPLIKYKSAGKKYVHDTLVYSNMIEAYCVAIQYTEDIIETYLDERDVLKKDPNDSLIRNYEPVVVSLYAKRIITKDFHDAFISAYGARNKIVHSITKRKGMPKKYNEEKFKKLPEKLMSLADKFVINDTVTLKNGGKLSIKERYINKVLDIIIDDLKLKKVKLTRKNINNEFIERLRTIYKQKKLLQRLFEGKKEENNN